MGFSPKRMQRSLETRGWVLRRITSSHHIYFHSELRKTVPVLVHSNRDIPKGTFFSILKQAGIDQEE